MRHFEFVLHGFSRITLSLSLLWTPVHLSAYQNGFVAPPGSIDNHIFKKETPETIVDFVLQQLDRDSDLQLHDFMRPDYTLTPSWDNETHGVDLGNYYGIEEAEILELILFNKLVEFKEHIPWHVFYLLQYMYNNQIVPLIPISEYGVDDPVESLVKILQGYGLVLRKEDGEIYSSEKVFGNYRLDNVKKRLITGSIDFSDVLMLHNWIKFKRLVDAATVAAALSFEARKGKCIELDPAIHDVARAHQGQIEVAGYMRSLLHGSEIAEGTSDVSTIVQDPYSYRGIPQVLGATVDAVRYFKNMLVQSIQGSARKDQDIDSVSLVMPGDLARIAAGELASIAERRVSILIDPNHSDGLSFFLTDIDEVNAGLNSSFMIPQYVQAAVVSILKALSHPLSFSLHESAEYTVAQKLNQVIEYVEYVLAIELMVAAQAIDLRQAQYKKEETHEKKQGAGTGSALLLVREVVDHLKEDRPFDEDIEAVKKQIQQGQYSKILSQVIGRSEIDMKPFPLAVKDDKGSQEGIVLDGLHVSVDEIGEVADIGVPVDIASDAYASVRESRAVVEDIIRRRLNVYGVTTGFGPHAKTFVEPEQAEELQLNLIRSHATGVGQHFDQKLVRAIMALRLNTLARGLSGVRPIVIETFKELLNRGVIPAVPCLGSVGASGDLAPLSHVALVLVGEGKAYYNKELMSGADALREAGIQPIVLSYKEGLALNNGTQVMTALGILNLRKLEKLFAQLKMMETNLSFPARMNTIQSNLKYARRILTTEINSALDNPLIVNGEVYYGANFHGQPVGMALEALRLVTRQISKMLINDLNNQLKSDSKVTRMMKAIDEDIGSSSHPSVVDSIPTSLGQEDHVSMATNAGLLNETVPKLEHLLALHDRMVLQRQHQQLPGRTRKFLRRLILEDLTNRHFPG
ncbi:MAG: aromatic amino acid lyase [bacterium]